MMRRRRFGTRRAKRRTSWLSGISSLGCATPLSIRRCNEVEVVTTDIFELLTVQADVLPGTSQGVGEMTLLRLVGELQIGCTTDPASASGGTALVLISEGIYLADAGQDGAVLIKTPGDVFDMTSKDWIWTRTSCIPFNSVSVREHKLAFSGEGAHIDITVKRKIRREESLIYAVDIALDQNAPTFVADGSGHQTTTVFPYIFGALRALVALP